MVEIKKYSAVVVPITDGKAQCCNGVTVSSHDKIDIDILVECMESSGIGLDTDKYPNSGVITYLLDGGNIVHYSVISIDRVSRKPLATTWYECNDPNAVDTALKASCYMQHLAESLPSLNYLVISSGGDSKLFDMYGGYSDSGDIRFISLLEHRMDGDMVLQSPETITIN